MDAAASARFRAWLKDSRGDLSQDALAKDISAKTGWNITRDRYSRYESGGLDVGKQTYEHFVAYWAGEGIEAPDLTPVPPVVELSVTELMLMQIEATRENTRMLERVLMALVPTPSGSPEPDPDELEARREIRDRESRLAAERAEGTSPRRRRDRSRQPEASGSAARVAGSAG